MPRLAQAAVFCSGNGSNFQAILNANKGHKLGIEIALMVCDNSKAHAVQRAHKAGIPVVLISPKLFTAREDYERFLIRILKSQKVDFIILAGFMRILTAVFIRAYKNRILNIHPSYLPEFKGAHAIRDAYESRVRRTGVSVHLVTLKLDSGPILDQERVTISPQDTLESLERKIHQVEHRLYPKAIRKFVQRYFKN